MPITPQYTWSETEATLEVTVDVPGVSRAKADVFATDAFLKVNCPPYLFALDLHKDVDDSRSSATIIPGAVVFKLFKREPDLWGCLAALGDKAELARRRSASIDRAYQEVEAARKARLARKQQEDKDATQRSMDMDRRKRQEVDRRKAEELAEERGKLEAWRQGLPDGGADAESDYEDEDEGEGERDQGGRADGAGTHGSHPEAPPPDHPDYHGRGWRPSKGAPDSRDGAKADGGAAGAPARAARGVLTPRGGSSGSEGEDEDEDEDEVQDRSAALVPSVTSKSAAPAPAVSFKPLPPPRTRLEPVPVNFTKLETGHLPAREQREEEIRAVRRQAREASSAPAEDPDTVDLAERQPLFLKDKGDQMFKAGNYSGALNAYSRAIQLDDSHTAVRANRAACRLALGDAAGCVEDCDRALEMLAERRDRLDHDLLEAADAAALRRQLVRLLVRRAQARVALAGGGGGGGGGSAARAGGNVGAAGELLAAAVLDYEEAMRLSPSDPSLESDYGELLAALHPSDAAALRQRGDARFRSGDYEGALEAFSALLGLPRSRVAESERLAAFSNRAACNLVLERYGAAVADCDAGLALLLPPASQGDPGGGGGGGGGGFGSASGEAGLARLSHWAESLQLTTEDGTAAAAAANGAANGTAAAVAAASGGCGLAPAAAVSAAARLLTRRGAAAAHLQLFAAAASDHQLAAALLRRLGEGSKAEAAEADSARMRALAEGREQLPPPPPPQQPAQQPGEPLPESSPQQEPHPGSGAQSEEVTQRGRDSGAAAALASMTVADPAEGTGAAGGGSSAPASGEAVGTAEDEPRGEGTAASAVETHGPATGGYGDGNAEGASLLDEVDD